MRSKCRLCAATLDSRKHLFVDLGHAPPSNAFLREADLRRPETWLPLQVLAAVRGAVGPDFPILAKLNLSDGFKGGLDIEDACLAARLLEQAGLDAIVMSGGLVSRTPMFLFRGDSPLSQMVPLEKNPLQRTRERLTSDIRELKEHVER